MRIVIVSDTHNHHESLMDLRGDVLIHCGDMFDMFDRANNDLSGLDEWFGKQDFELVLCTGGNHDAELQDILQRTAKPFRNAVYLENASFVHEGLKFWGAPWTPGLPGHAFYKTSNGVREAWSTIPSDTDVVITHTPPWSILDVSSRGTNLGCPELLDAIARVQPKIHCFGHVHNSRGETVRNGTRFLNASSVGREVAGTHPAMIVDV